MKQLAPLVLLVACVAPNAPAPSEAARVESPSAREEAPAVEEPAARAESTARAAQERPAPEQPVPTAGTAERASRANRTSALEPESGPRRPYVEELAALPPLELSGVAAERRAREAFLALSDGERRDVLDWFRLECSQLGTFQMVLVSWVLQNQDVDPASWPDLRPLESYDAKVHAPAQPIPRRPLRPDAPEVVAVRNKILGAIPPRRVEPGWMYDWGEQQVVRLPGHDDALRIFENGLRGMPPSWDLVEALVERALDDGAEQTALHAFSHAYSDRWGGVYAGVTLYDAHASRTDLEMPDVDCLGLVHQITGDWDTWKAVITADQQPSLYAKVAELFERAQRHRGLRQNLARAFLAGSTELRDGYQGHLDNFHALWESAASTPDTLRGKLPAVEAWSDFLQDWHDQLVADPSLLAKGHARRATLEQGAARVREALFWVLDQYGAFARIEEPPLFDR